MFRLLKLRNFFYLFVGESVSVAGDQAYFVMLPWLILQYTGSTVALGTVLTVATIPRIVLSLFGGAVSDQMPSRLLMISANLIRGAVLFGLFGVVAHGKLQLWHLYTVSFVSGFVEAFFAPAYASLVPCLVMRCDVERANALLRSASQCIVLLAPGPFGLLVAHTGIGTAFFADGFSFSFAASTLCMLRNVRQPGRVLRKTLRLGAVVKIFTDVRAGIEYVWTDRGMRSVLAIHFLARVAFLGPFMLGMATLAHAGLSGGIVSFGLIFSVMSGGAMVGALSAVRMRGTINFSALLLLVLATFSAGTGLIAFSQKMGLILPVVFALGAGAGVINLIIFTWIQTRSDEKCLGRTMSIVMLCSLAAEPLSFLIAGIVARAGVSRMFLLSSIAMGLLGLLCRLNNNIRAIT